MLTRRVVLQAAAFQGLGAGLRPAFAQARPRKTSKKKPGTGDPRESQRPPVEADERLSKLLAPVRDEHHLPGLIGAIMRGDRLAAIGAVGIRKIGSAQPIRVTDQVHIGSCTKAMTATLIGMMVDEGKLTWGSTIREVFPDHADQIHPDFQAVTLSHLLTHRAGLPANVPWRGLPGASPTEQRYAILATQLRNPPQQRPGSTYSYSNVGYALAGLMAEKVSDRPWTDLMQKRLFEPLGMSTAGFGAPGRPGGIDQPWGHRGSGGQVRPAQIDNPPSLGPAGTVHCSVPDWGRFAALHLAGARGRAKLLKASTFRALQTPPPGSEYAGGWIVCQRTWASGRALTHNGSNTVWFATIWLAPALNLAFLAVTNQGDKTAQTATDEAIVVLIRAADFLVRPADDNA